MIQLVWLKIDFRLLIAFTLSYKLFIHVCQVTRIERVTHALLEMQAQKITIEVSRAFYNICIYTFETPCSKVFLKPAVFMLEWMISKNVSPFKYTTLRFTRISIELYILFKFSETDTSIHFVSISVKMSA